LIGNCSRTARDEAAYRRYVERRPPQAGADHAVRAAGAAEGSAQCELLRDLFGDLVWPRPVLPPDWRTAAVRRLAGAMYEGRDFGAMPVLGDALEEAGCDDAGILGHCRSEGHARGCWLVDGILGKGVMAAAPSARSPVGPIRAPRDRRS
jgi:hypothetical protein